MSYEPGISKIKKSKTGGVKDYARAILGQGLGLGFGDEAEAYVRSILSGKEYDEVIKQYDKDSLPNIIKRQETQGWKCNSEGNIIGIIE